MGLTTTKIELRNPRRPDLPAVEVDALADTGSDLMCIPPQLQRQLGLEEAESRTIVLADGTRRSVPYVGPLQLRFANRTGFGGALVMGDQPLLGAIAMQDMDLVVIPRTRRVAVNPASPDAATVSARRLAA
ncbi:MAG: clan AA aspartic protease [Gammaproteobacteria bacterium]|nr:clan AA aspartic protease [Gammaproteobacteria bacterium]